MKSVNLKLLRYFFVGITGAAAGLVLSSLIPAVFFVSDYRTGLPPCFEFQFPFHHRFRSSCRGTMETPAGSVEIQTNEDGLRDKPRGEILSEKKRVLLMGDSFVEGWWASFEQTPSFYLRSQFPGFYFINGGLRSTGPSMQATRLKALLPIYRPAAVIWVLNDTDGFDERLSCALADRVDLPVEARKLSTPEIELADWEKLAIKWTGSEWLSRRIQLFFYEKRWREIVGSDVSQKCSLCDGVNAFFRIAAEAGVPVFTVYLDSERMPLLGHYQGGGVLRAGLQDCFHERNLPLRKESLHRIPPGDEAKFFWKNDFHLNPDGVRFLVRELAGDVRVFLEKL